MQAAVVDSAWPAPPPYYLQPRREPPAPIAGKFSMFGVQRDTSPEPAPELEKQLYPSNTASPCAELRRLNRSLLHSFLQLLQLMEESPMQCNTEVAHIQTLLLNMHHLLNSFRPHHAFDQLIGILQAQVDAKQKLLDELDAASCSAHDISVEDLKETAPLESNDADSDSGVQGSRKREFDELMGSVNGALNRNVRQSSAEKDSAEIEIDSLEAQAKNNSIGGNAKNETLAKLLQSLDTIPPP